MSAALDIGVWIDHAGATIVSISPGGAEPKVSHIESNVESVHRARGHQSNRSATHRAAGSPKKDENRRDEELHRYYEAVIAAVKHADRLFLFGHNGAKEELERQMRGHMGLFGKVIGVEPADRLTENQLKARVCAFFKAHPDTRYRRSSA